MKLPKWSVPFALRLLSLAGLTSAAGAGADKALSVGFGLGFTLSNPAASLELAQPQPLHPDLSLDVDFLVQVANHELRIPIMPLNLLGHKSWNVYNKDNIEKVKRDESRAKAKEEAEEQRMQEIDAERRIQILRGETPTPLPEVEDKADDGERRERGSGRERKRRKKAGENDTNFEMRIAHEQTASNSERQIVLRKPIDAPLVDESGHIDLFPQERPSKPEKNAEAERELAKKKKEYEDQYTMKFSNAAGFKQGLENPWYSKAGLSDEVDEDMPGKDVWGNEDPRRKEREAARVVSNDPLAMMRQGAAQVRQVEKERKRWREEKEKEMRDLIESEERRKKRKRKHQEDDDDLEDIRLERSSSRRHDDDRERKHRHRHRSSHGDEDRSHKRRHKRHHWD